MRLFELAKKSLDMPTGPDASIFVGVRGQQMDNSTLAKIVVSEMSAAGVDFRATPNRFRHSTVTIVSHTNDTIKMVD